MNSTGFDELDEVIATLAAGKTATPVTIRTFLSWFGAKRRTSANVAYIDSIILAAGIRTVPEYTNIWVDTPITFELISEHPHPQPDQNEQEGHAITQTEGLAAEDDDTASDPTFRIGHIKSANTPPVSVKPNASLLEATTLMLSRNYSQLPVMTSDREVKGVISWESIGSRSATGASGPDVQAYMDDHREISAATSLFTAIRTIVEYNYVLVRGTDRKISGIVTSSDIALQFESISTPFLLMAEIENSIRTLITAKLSIADVKRSCQEEFLPRNFSRMSELTFGNYVRILENSDNWKKLGIQLDRATFCAELSEVNEIRNDVMHFDPDPLTEEGLTKLRNMSKLLDLLRNLGAF